MVYACFLAAIDASADLIMSDALSRHLLPSCDPGLFGLSQPPIPMLAVLCTGPL